MPKRLRTVEEENYTKLVNKFNIANHSHTTFYEDFNKVKYLANNFDYHTNLGYYNDNPPKDDDEKEEYLKLKIEEQYRKDIFDKYQVYFDQFNKVNESYKLAKDLQGQKIELERAAKHQNDLIEAAKKDGAENINLEPITTDVKGLEEARKDFNKSVLVLNEIGKDIRTFEKEDVLKKLQAEGLESFYKERDVRLKKEAEAEQKRRDERDRKLEESRKAEAEQKKKEDAEAEARMQHHLKGNKINHLREESRRNVMEDGAQGEIDNLVGEFKIKEKLEGKETYECPGFDKPITLKQAFDSCKEGMIALYGNYRKQSQTSLNTEIAGDLGDGFESAVSNFKNKYVTTEEFLDKSDKAHPKTMTRDKYFNLKDRNGDKSIDARMFLSENANKDSKTGERVGKLVGFANQFAQMHHKTEKPGFFSKLFNTKYNQAYKNEEELLNSMRNALKDNLSLDEKFVDKILDEKSCYDPIDKQELLDAYINSYGNHELTDEVYFDKTNLSKQMENQLMMDMVNDVYKGKNPIESLNENLKEINEEIDHFNEREKEYGSSLDYVNNRHSKEMSKGLNNRIPFEVKECRNGEQVIEDGVAYENLDELELEEEDDLNKSIDLGDGMQNS